MHGTVVTDGTTVTYTPLSSYAGPDTFDYTASNGSGTSSPATVSVTVAPPTIAYAPSASQTATAGVATTLSVAGASGGTGPYTYAVITGALPNGLSLSTDGVISGTPTAVGTSTVGISAKDTSTGTGPFSSAPANITLTVAGPTLTLGPAVITSWVAGVAIAPVTMTAGGGTAPYAYRISAGQLPPGITLSGNVISGAPAAGGTYSFTVEASDSTTGGASFTVVRTYSGQVSAPAITLSPSSLNDGTVGQAYDQTFTASGGTAPYSFNGRGSLPQGMSFDATHGRVSGTPLSSGTYSFTVTTTDAQGFSGTTNYSLHVTGASQTISFANPGTQNYGTTPTLVASSSSGLTVTFSSETTAVCTITSGGALTFVSAGSCTIDEDQAGNGTYAAAPTVHDVFAVSAVVPGAPTIGAATPGNALATVNFTPPASNGGSPVTGFTVTSNPGNFTGTASGAATSATVTGLTNGTAYSFTVTAQNTAGSGPASARSNAVTPIAPQTISFANPGNQNFGTQPQLNATATSGLAVTFSSATTNVCTVTSGGVLTTVAPGNCTIHADQTGNAAFLAAPETSNSFAIVVPGGSVSLATPSPLPGATGGVPYSITLNASGGAAPYTFSESGALPGGMSFMPSGLLTGLPTSSGTYTFTVTVSDAATQSAQKTYQLTINAPGIGIAPSALPQGKVGEAFAPTTLTATGGTSPYSYAVTSGALPAGLVLNPAGVISGTPTQAGSTSVTMTATDKFGFQGVQSYTVVVLQNAPVVADTSLATPANASVTLHVTSASGPVSGATVTAQPAHGTVTVNGLDLIYTPANNYFGADSYKYTAHGVGGVSNVATVSITVSPLALPTVTAQSATVLAGKSVTVHATAGAANGPFTAVNVTSPPSSGQAVVQGTDIIYTADANASGTVGFDFTVSNPFGASQPAHATITVNARPVAAALTATAIAGTSVAVNLTNSAHGGPFTAANIVAVSPANAGTATVNQSGSGYTLNFTAAPTFGGVASISYTLTNAFATSDLGNVSVSVTLRSDPSKDAEVLGVLDAQADSARRMATGQISNFQRRLESLHQGGSGGVFSNGFTFSSASTQRTRTQLPDDDHRFGGPNTNDDGGWNDLYGPPAKSTATPDGSSNSLPGGIAIWTGGAVNFGKSQPGSSGNGIDFTTSGLSLGADKQVNEKLTVGVGLGYGHDSSDIGQKTSHSSVDSYNVAMYASYHPADSFYTDALVGYQWLSMDDRRYVTDNGNTVHGSRDGKQWFASLSVGYDRHSDDMVLTPYGRLDVARANLEGYTETGDAVYALKYQGQDVNTSTATVGVLAQWTAKRDYGTWAPQLRAEFGHDMQGSSQATMRYADVLTGPSYQATLLNQSRNHTMLGVGVALQTFHGWMIRAEYQNLLDNTSRDNQSILLGVEKKFGP